jgi:coenzyme PQQ precursor peptide PqqA
MAWRTGLSCDPFKREFCRGLGRESGRLKASNDTKENDMKWTAPKFVEVSCGMEINRYAPADGSEPVLF